MVDLNLCSVIYFGHVRHHLSLHLKIPKPREDRLPLVGAHLGDGLHNSPSPATTALPCQDFTSLSGRLMSTAIPRGSR